MRRRPDRCSDRLKAAVDESRASDALRPRDFNATAIFSHNQDTGGAHSRCLEQQPAPAVRVDGRSHAVGTDEGGWATNLTRLVDDAPGRAALVRRPGAPGRASTKACKRASAKTRRRG